MLFSVEQAKQLSKAGKLKQAGKTAFYATKDTVSIPPNGYALFRFKANNPGWWLLHCHFGN